MVPLCEAYSIIAGTSRPAGSNSVVRWSCTATTLAPASWNSLAATAPTLPKPCTATRAPLISRPILRAASEPTTNTPRPVASWRPSEPPSEIGLPVTTPVAVLPEFIEYVSIIQAMTWALVFTSGAGISLLGPMMMLISLV